MLATLAVNSATVNPRGGGGQGEGRGEGGADAGLVQVDAAGAGGSELSGHRQLVEDAVGQEADIGAVQGGGEPPGHAGQPGDDLVDVGQVAAAA
jgi:hypothetical protein